MQKWLLFALIVSFSSFNVIAEERDLKHAINEINRLVNNGLTKNKVTINAKITDATFLRRVFLDIMGRIPTPEEADKFHAEKSTNKRSMLINSLLNSEGYISDQLNYWSDILRITQN